MNNRPHRSIEALGWQPQGFFAFICFLYGVPVRAEILLASYSPAWCVGQNGDNDGVIPESPEEAGFDEDINMTWRVAPLIPSRQAKVLASAGKSPESL